MTAIKFADEEKNKVVAGTKLIAIGTRGYPDLTEQKSYIAINGAEEGIFETRPFVTVVGDKGINLSCHLSRFIIKKEQEQ